MSEEEFTKRHNDEIEFLDSINILELIKDHQDIWELREIIEEKYSKDYYEEFIFNCTSTGEFVDYLQKRYGNDIYIQEHTEYTIHLK